MNINPANISEKDFNSFKEDFAQDIINTFKKTDSKTKDYAAANSAEDNARQRERMSWDREDRAKVKQEEERQKKEFLEPARNEKNELVKDPSGGDVLTFGAKTAPELRDGSKLDRVVLEESPEEGTKIKLVTVKEKLVPIRNEKGTHLKDQKGNPRYERTEEEKIIEGDTELNTIIRNMRNPETDKNFIDLEEFTEFSKRRKEAKNFEGLEDISQEEIDAL